MTTCLYSKLASGFDAQALLTEYLKLVDGQWANHVNETDYFGTWDVAALRCKESHAKNHPILQCFDIEPTSRWQSLCQFKRSDIFRSMFNWFECEIYAIRLMRLAAQSHIHTHRDHGVNIENDQARIHIPLQTSKLTTFQVADYSLFLGEGEVWYINIDQPHSVQNSSDKERIHLVIDCHANEWLKRKIQQGHTCYV